MNFYADVSGPLDNMLGETSWTPEELIYTWMGPNEGTLNVAADDYLPWDTEGVQECMVKCPLDNQYLTPSQDQYEFDTALQLYSHSTFERGICQRSEFCPQSGDWNGGVDTFGDIDSGLCITKSECNAKAAVGDYTWSTYSTGRAIGLSDENPALTEVNNDYGSAGDYPLQYLCVESCKGMAYFLEEWSVPTEEYPYDPHGGALFSGLKTFDPNYKAVTHDGTCLHTCPSFFDDSLDLMYLVET